MRILRLLSSRPLPCGCLLGIYETYSGPIVTILDARGDDCRDATHRPGVQVSEPRPAAPGRRPPTGPSRPLVR
jgi:hypothetical protein